VGVGEQVVRRPAAGHERREARRLLAAEGLQRLGVAARADQVPVGRMAAHGGQPPQVGRLGWGGRPGRAPGHLEPPPARLGWWRLDPEPTVRGVDVGPAEPGQHQLGTGGQEPPPVGRHGGFSSSGVASTLSSQPDPVLPGSTGAARIVVSTRVTW
jgi:hypothetical protein